MASRQRVLTLALKTDDELHEYERRVLRLRAITYDNGVPDARSSYDRELDEIANEWTCRLQVSNGQ